MGTFLAVFLFELLAAYILWFVLKKVFKITKSYRIAIICLVLSLAVGYMASRNIVGYEVTMDYLTEINNQKIELTGESITLKEEEQLKEELVNNEEFQKLLITEPIKLSLYPFIPVIFLMLFSARRAIKNVE